MRSMASETIDYCKCEKNIWYNFWKNSWQLSTNGVEWWYIQKRKEKLRKMREEKDMRDKCLKYDGWASCKCSRYVM